MKRKDLMAYGWLLAALGVACPRAFWQAMVDGAGQTLS